MSNHNNTSHQIAFISARKQEGVALLISLIMLLLITVIGVSAVRMSMSDTQVAGNSIYSSLVYQGAESGLNRSLSDSDISNLRTSANKRSEVFYIDDLDDEQVIGGSTLKTTASIKFEGIMNGPQINSVANSSMFVYQVFKVTAQSKLKGTSARDTHSEGRALQMPSN